MLPDRVSNTGPLTYESGVLLIALHGLAISDENAKILRHLQIGSFQAALPEVKCLHLMFLRFEMCMPSISNMNYCKFSHGAASYMLSGKQLELW